MEYAYEDKAREEQRVYGNTSSEKKATYTSSLQGFHPNPP